MPINRKKMKALKDEYGSEKGKRIYYALENKERHRKHRMVKKKSLLDR